MTKVLWVKPKYLAQIMSGNKTVEVRVGYANIKRLKPGDGLLLNDQHPFTIVDIRSYPSFEALATVEDIGSVAPDLPDKEALIDACRAIYPPEKEALGAIALEIAPVNSDEEE